MLKKLLIAALVAAPLSLMAQTVKLGYVDATEIINVMPEKITAESTLKTVADKYEAEFKNLQTAFQKKVEEYQKADEDPATPQAIKDRHQTELQEDYTKIQNFSQQAQHEVQKQQETLFGPIYQKVRDAIQAVGAEGGYTFILDPAAILYQGTGAEDIGPKVKAKLGIK